MKVPLKYPTNVHFSSVCCGTTSPVTVCNFMTEFLKSNRIERMLVLYVPLLQGEGDYTLHFPLNNFSRIQKIAFAYNLETLVNNIKPLNESDGTIRVLHKNKTFMHFNKRIQKTVPWSLVNYDSTMKCPSWSMLKPLAGSPDMMKK